MKQAKQSSRWVLINSILWIGIAGLILIYVGADLYKQMRLWINGVETTAEVVESSVIPGRIFLGSVSYRYDVPDQLEPVIQKGITSAGMATSLKAGDTVMIRFVASNPTVSGITDNQFILETSAILLFFWLLWGVKPTRRPRLPFKFRPGKK